MALSLTSLRKPIVITALAVFAVIIGLALIFLQAANLRHLKTEVEDEKMALDQSEALLNQRLEHQKNAVAYQERYARLKLMIPDNPEEEEILRYFAYLAEEYDLEIPDIRFGERVASEGQAFIQMPLEIAMEGRYRELVALLNHLNRGERAIRVNTIGITLSSAEPAQIQIVISAGAFHSIIE